VIIISCLKFSINSPNIVSISFKFVFLFKAEKAFIVGCGYVKRKLLQSYLKNFSSSFDFLS